MLRFVFPGQDVLRTAASEMMRMTGVTSVVTGPDHMVVEYDLFLIVFEQIEAAVSRSGLVLRGGLYRWRRALWRFTEANEIENAAHPLNGACCNRPPTRLR
jgi:hypothetical protein